MADFDQNMQSLLLSLKASDAVRGKLSKLGLTTVHLMAAVGDEDLTKAFSSEADTVTTRTTAFALKAAAKLLVSRNDDVVPLPGQPDALLRSLVEACQKTVKDGPPPEFFPLPRHMKRLYVAPLTYLDFAELVPSRNQTPASAIRYEVSLDGSVVAVQNNNKLGKISSCSDWFSAFCVWATGLLMVSSKEREDKFSVDPFSLLVYANRIMRFATIGGFTGAYRYDAAYRAKLNGYYLQGCEVASLLRSEKDPSLWSWICATNQSQATSSIPSSSSAALSSTNSRASHLPNKRKICYALRYGGQCKFGDACAFSHDFSKKESPTPPPSKKPSSTKQSSSSSSRT